MTEHRVECKFDGCTNKKKTQGYCERHCRDLRAAGVISAPPKLSLEERFWSHVDKSGSCWIWTANKTLRGYGMYQVGWRGRSTTAHRFAYEFSVGPIPEGMQIDHMCHNRLCVNPDHLRPVTNKQNNENPAGLRSDNTSGYRGVYFHKRLQKWCARAQHNNKNYVAGFFKTPEEAAEAARQLRLSLYTHNDADRRSA